MKRVAAMSIALLAGCLVSATVVTAQEPVAPLQDLVGARGRDGEAQMNGRGYKYVRVDSSDQGAYTFWREPKSNRCVSVLTADGRYSRIVYTPEFDCQGGGAATQLPASAPESENQFTTVCGVETGGKTLRYRCTVQVEGCKGQGHCRTVVTMPDNEYTIVSKQNDEVEVTFQGMTARKTTTSFRDGQTRFSFDDKVYFVYRSPDRAKRELAGLGK